MRLSPGAFPARQRMQKLSLILKTPCSFSNVPSLFPLETERSRHREPFPILQ